MNQNKKTNEDEANHFLTSLNQSLDFCIRTMFFSNKKV